MNKLEQEAKLWTKGFRGLERDGTEGKKVFVKCADDLEDYKRLLLALEVAASAFTIGFTSVTVGVKK